MYRSGLCSSLATLSRGVSLGGDLFGSSGISSYDCVYFDSIRLVTADGRSIRTKVGPFVRRSFKLWVIVVSGDRMIRGN